MKFIDNISPESNLRVIESAYIDGELIEFSELRRLASLKSDVALVHNLYSYIGILRNFCFLARDKNHQPTDNQQKSIRTALDKLKKGLYSS